MAKKLAILCAAVLFSCSGATAQAQQVIEGHEVGGPHYPQVGRDAARARKAREKFHRELQQKTEKLIPLQRPEEPKVAAEKAVPTTPAAASAPKPVIKAEQKSSKVAVSPVPTEGTVEKSLDTIPQCRKEEKDGPLITPREEISKLGVSDSTRKEITDLVESWKLTTIGEYEENNCIMRKEVKKAGSWKNGLAAALTATKTWSWKPIAATAAVSLPIGALLAIAVVYFVKRRGLQELERRGFGVGSFVCYDPEKKHEFKVLSTHRDADGVEIPSRLKCNSCGAEMNETQVSMHLENCPSILRSKMHKAI